MNILVINGSPKGKNSVTLQTVNFLSILHPEHTFEILHVGQRIRGFEKDFTPARKAIEKADLILFSYPVYTFIAPSQLHRFVELMKAQNLDLSQKFATQLTTSKHFYDMTAHRYIEDNCADLGLKYIRGLSADMDDLTKPRGQQEAEDFFRYILWSVKNNIFEPKSASGAVAAVHHEVTVPEVSCPKKKGDVVIITDLQEDDVQLKAMIDRFRARLPYHTRLVNLRDYPFQGGCLGCFNCAVSGKCIYTDGFDEYLRNEIQTADAMVYAFTVRDHSMGARFKMFDDRQFCNGHRTVTIGMPVGYLVNGCLSAEENLRTILTARAEVGHNYFAGIAGNEEDPNGAIDILCKKLRYALRSGYLPPQNFYGIGGMKVFRDLIWLMQGMMRADHKFYKAQGQYDFPQKQWPKMLAMYGVGYLMGNEKLKQKAGSKMTEGMLMPYNRVLEKAKQKMDR